MSKPAFATPAARLDAVRTVGKGIRITETATAAIVATLPEGFDPKASGAITGAIHLWATGCACPSGRGKTCQCGKRQSVKVGGKATDYGRGVDTLTTAVRTALKGEGDDTAPDYLALVLAAADTARDKGNVDATAVATAVAEWAARNLA